MFRSALARAPPPSRSAARAARRLQQQQRTAASALRPSAEMQLPPLVGYAIRRAAAFEMLYGGVRVMNLNQKPFSLHYTRSEDLPSPSLSRERHDLQLEMQLPRDTKQLGYDNASIHIQRQLGYGSDEVDDANAPRKGFAPGEYFSTLFHPERHHNSSLPYASADTNNVLGLRLFPLNLGVRMRVEAVRVRTDDLRQRAEDYALCLQHGLPTQYPMPMPLKAALRARLATSGPCGRTLYSGSLDHHRFASTPPSADATATAAAERTAHLRRCGGRAHPHPRELSVFTRPADIAAEVGEHATTTTAPAAAAVDLREAARRFSRQQRDSPRRDGTPLAADAAAAGRLGPLPQSWMPLQLILPLTHTWSASVRGSGVRGPYGAFFQERLDQKGNGWKRKSRSLWQQDVDTAGFRPHRFF